MKISLNWLNDYVDLSGLTPEAVADKLTRCTAEIEGIERRGAELSGIVAARVLEAGKVEGADKLSFLKVDDGSGEALPVICGAPNARAGITVAFARVGGSITGMPKVKKAKIRGVESFGFACSERELGVSEDHGGVLELDGSLTPGSPVEEAVPDLFDALLEIDNKSITHRPDLWGHYGFARELAALFGRELKPLDLIDEAELQRGEAVIDSAIEDPVHCPRYTSLLFGAVKPGPAPFRMRARLHYAGMRPINLIVDLSNYIMLETGQPTHCFDRDVVKTIRVRSPRETVSFKTLDGQERKLPPGTLMIYDRETPIAIGGVMGGLDSEISDGTTGLLLESANFEPACIRRTANALGLRTDAAIRYEKSLDPELTLLAVRRFARLLQSIQPNASIDSRVSDENFARRDPIRIETEKRFFDAYFGKTIEPGRIESILTSLEFDVKSDGERIEAVVPSFRATKDVSIPPDLVEEVARVYGYENIKPETPAVKLESVEVNASRRAERNLKNLLASKFGFHEIQSYGFFDDLWLREIGFEPANAIRLKNPAAEHQSRMRTSLVPNLLQAVEINKMNFDAFNLFEFGSVFEQQEDGPREEKRLAGILFTQRPGTDGDGLFSTAKGVVEALTRNATGREPDFQTADRPPLPWEPPYKRSTAALDGVEIGVVSAFHPTIARKFGKTASGVVFDLRFDRLLDIPSQPVKFKEIPKFPEADLDFTFLVPKTESFAAVRTALSGFEHKFLVRLKYLYAYEGENLPEGKKSLTFSVRIGSPKGTLAREQIDRFSEGFIQYAGKAGYRLT